MCHLWVLVPSIQAGASMSGRLTSILETIVILFALSTPILIFIAVWLLVSPHTALERLATLVVAGIISVCEGGFVILLLSGW